MNAAIIIIIIIIIIMNSLGGDRFMPEIYIRQQGFTSSACGPLTKNKE